MLPGLIALIQATETVKIVTGIGEPLHGRLLQYDALRMEFNEFRLRKDPECPVCGEAPSIKELIDYEGFCGMPAEEAPRDLAEISAVQLRDRLESEAPLLLLDVRESDEVAAARIEGATWIPLGELEARLVELDPWRKGGLVVHCHHGMRSTKACRLLADAGFRGVENLTGGIEAWSLTVDPRVPRY